jgi:hypothetical protein
MARPRGNGGSHLAAGRRTCDAYVGRSSARRQVGYRDRATSLPRGVVTGGPARRRPGGTQSDPARRPAHRSRARLSNQAETRRRPLCTVHIRRADVDAPLRWTVLRVPLLGVQPAPPDTIGHHDEGAWPTQTRSPCRLPRQVVTWQVNVWPWPGLISWTWTVSWCTKTTSCRARTS